MTLADLGWNDEFQRHFTPCQKKGWVPARLIRDNKISYGALLEDGDELEVIMGGKVYHDATCDAELPAVGDWVALDLSGEEVVIRSRLPRQTRLSRKVPGKSTEEQIMAANVDYVVVVTEAGVDFNLRRMERYFAIIARSGAKPVVLINKADLYSSEVNNEAYDEIIELSKEADVYITRADKNEGLEVMKRYFNPGVTVMLVGSSGVGKSTIVNQLLGEDYQWTGEVNSMTGKGTHTTTARELIMLPDGGLLIDNPGIREVQMWTDATTLRESFADLVELAKQCKYHDCKHRSDEGCAIRAAVERGELSEERYRGFLKLDEEIARLEGRRKKRQMTIERRNKRAKQNTKSRSQANRIDPDHEEY